MEKKTIEIKNILKKIISNSNSKHISFSGGLDSSIITSHLNEQQKNALVVITDDFIANDLTYSQIAAKHFQLKLDIFNVNSEKLLDAIEGTISILKNFNDIEIRNSVVMYLAFNELKNNDVHDVLTGDGADELFAGYNFLLDKPENELRDEIIRIHLSTDFFIYMVGFIPGHPFMGDLDSKLFLNRLKTPRVKIPAGSVGIVEKFLHIFSKSISKS